MKTSSDQTEDRHQTKPRNQQTPYQSRTPTIYETEQKQAKVPLAPMDPDYDPNRRYNGMHPTT